VDGRTETERGGRQVGRAGVARVADGRDTGAEALDRAEARDREVILEAEERLALHVRRDPLVEREPVAEAAVDGVLEVRVRVDETRDDCRAFEARPPAELRRGA